MDGRLLKRQNGVDLAEDVSVALLPLLKAFGPVISLSAALAEDLFKESGVAE